VRLRILTWNCNGAFRKKYHLLDSFEADILVIQECEDPQRSSEHHYQNYASNHLWEGLNKSKGIGVFAKDNILLNKVELNLEPLELFLPCKINNEIPLLATWTKQANSPNFRYIGQLWKLLQIHKSFLDNPQAMLIGDLNSNKQWDEWDRWWNHSDVVRELSELGLNSGYHEFFNEAQGEETKPTLYLQRNLNKNYHIDYGFFGKHWKLNLVQVGEAGSWLDHSDHMPMLFEVVSQ
jgi:endonuclease/exonuclease/phosphatase family metal-dependent hydrolase